MVTFIPEWAHWKLVGHHQAVRRSEVKWDAVRREAADEPCKVCGWKFRPGEPRAIRGRNTGGRWQVYCWVHQPAAGERSYLYPGWRSSPEWENPRMEDDYAALKAVVCEALRENTVANEGEIEMRERLDPMAECVADAIIDHYFIRKRPRRSAPEPRS
jgi:hypothetical protein